MAAILAVSAASEPEEEVAYLWPCNVRAWGVWSDVQTQWRYAASGNSTGMDYAAVRAHMDELGLCGDERKEIYAGIRAAERARLEVLATQAEQKQ